MKHSSTGAFLDSACESWWLTGQLAQWNHGYWRHFTKPIKAAMVVCVFNERWLRKRGHGWLVRLKECGGQQGLSGQRQRRLRCRGQTLLIWTYLEKGVESDRKWWDNDGQEEVCQLIWWSPTHYACHGWRRNFPQSIERHGWSFAPLLSGHFNHATLLFRTHVYFLNFLHKYMIFFIRGNLYFSNGHFRHGSTHSLLSLKPQKWKREVLLLSLHHIFSASLGISNSKAQFPELST